MNDEELKMELKKLKKGGFISLSEWYGSRNQSGCSGYLISLNNNGLYEFESKATFEPTFETHANINKLLTISNESRNRLVEYIKNEKLFYFNKVEKLVMDYGTTIEVSIENIHSEIINADSMCSRGKFFIYNDLLKMIKGIIELDKNIVLNPEEEKEEVVFNEESIFTVFKDLDFNELLNLRNQKIRQCHDKVDNINLNSHEIANSGMLFWNVKMIIENIRLIDSKLINKFNTYLNADLKEIVENELKILNEAEYFSIEDVSYVLDKIKYINEKN